MDEPRLFGRALDLAETAVTVQVRDGQTILTAEAPGTSDEALTRINVIECADLDAALALVAGQRAATASATPYLLLSWIPHAPATVTGDRGLIADIEAWRRAVDAQGRYVMGSSLGGIEAAATQGMRDPRTVAADTPFNQVDDLTVAVEVVLAANRRRALELAAAHPLARTQTVEVRPFLRTD